jgi:biopolymer transport protein ExbD
MKMGGLLTEEPTISGVNVVPVIDLCLVLLIVLMVTSPMLDTADLPVKLPQALTIESKERNISVTYAPDGRVAINSEIVTDDQFDAALRKKLTEVPGVLVILRMDKSATYATLTSMIARCKKIGATNISIGTEQTKVNK